MSKEEQLKKIQLQCLILRIEIAMDRIEKFFKESEEKDNGFNSKSEA